MKIDIVYIAGEHRSGTTIIDRVLGTLPGVTSLNEVTRVLSAGFAGNDYCACGERFSDCPFWSRVAREAGLDGSRVDPLLRLKAEIESPRHLPQLYSGVYGPGFRKKIERYTEWLEKLYSALARASGNNVLVDSSKAPGRALLLKATPGLQVHVIHVVRDVRAVVHSKAREKYDPATGRPLPVHSPVSGTFDWAGHNLLCELLASRLPYVKVRYEDFARHPRATMQWLVERVAPLAGKRCAFESEDVVRLEPLHSLAGNPDRFVSGPTTIREDGAWARNLNPGTRRLATLLAYPLLWRYGYR